MNDAGLSLLYAALWLNPLNTRCLSGRLRLGECARSLRSPCTHGRSDPFFRERLGRDCAHGAWRKNACDRRTCWAYRGCCGRLRCSFSLSDAYLNRLLHLAHSRCCGDCRGSCTRANAWGQAAHNLARPRHARHPIRIPVNTRANINTAFAAHILVRREGSWWQLRRAFVTCERLSAHTTKGIYTSCRKHGY